MQIKICSIACVVVVSKYLFIWMSRIEWVEKVLSSELTPIFSEKYINIFHSVSSCFWYNYIIHISLYPSEWSMGFDECYNGMLFGDEAEWRQKHHDASQFSMNNHIAQSKRPSISMIFDLYSSCGDWIVRI